MLVETECRRRPPPADFLSTFPKMKILSSGDRLPWDLKWSRGNRNAPAYALIYRNGDSSSLAKEQEWPSRLLHFLHAS